METIQAYSMIGLMSGTSLDGLDIAFVTFKKTLKGWGFELNTARTIAYPLKLKERLANCIRLSAIDLKVLDVELGVFFGEVVASFIAKEKIDPSTVFAVSSHGHTVFHEPNKGITMQIGNGGEGAAISGINWVCDFRLMDVALGGNGAPLVPVGDAMLFSSHAESYLNLGGFSNISYFKNGEWKAFDICPVNLVFNHFAKEKGMEYDKDGDLGRDGKLDTSLLDRLNDLSYYGVKGPKSLGVEWLMSSFFPELKFASQEKDAIATVYHHVAYQIANVLNNEKIKSVLITGGGAKNTFLLDLIKEKYSGEVVVPEEAIVDYKEAIVFAFLGLLRFRNEVNVFSSVTGAKKDHSGGYVYLA